MKKILNPRHKSLCVVGIFSALFALPLLIPKIFILELQYLIGAPEKTIVYIMYYAILFWIIGIFMHEKFKWIPLVVGLLVFIVSSIFTFSSFRELSPLSHASIRYLAMHENKKPPKGKQIEIAKKLIEEGNYMQSLEHINIEIDFWPNESIDAIESVLAQLKTKNSKNEFVVLYRRYEDLVSKRLDFSDLDKKLDSLVSTYKQSIEINNNKVQLYQRRLNDISLAFSFYEKSEYKKAEEYCKRLLRELGAKGEEEKNNRQLIYALMSNVRNADKLYNDALEEFKKANPQWKSEIENAFMQGFESGSKMAPWRKAL